MVFRYFLHSVQIREKPVHFEYNSRGCLEDTHREKICFTQFSTRMDAWLLLTFSLCVHKSVKFYTFHYTHYRVQMFEKCDSSNRQ